MRSSASPTYSSNIRLREALAKKSVLPPQITVKLLSKSSMEELGHFLCSTFYLKTPIADCNDIGPLRFVEHVCFFRRATREDRSRPQVCHSNEQGRLVQRHCKALSVETALSEGVIAGDAPT